MPYSRVGRFFNPNSLTGVLDQDKAVLKNFSFVILSYLHPKGICKIKNIYSMRLKSCGHFFKQIFIAGNFSKSKESGPNNDFRKYTLFVGNFCLEGMDLIFLDYKFYLFILIIYIFTFRSFRF